MKHILNYSYNGRPGVTLPYRDIILIRTLKPSHRIEILGKNYRKELYGSLQEIQELDQEEYLHQVTRSLLINLDNVKAIDYKHKTIVFCDDSQCTISAIKMRELKKYIKNNSQENVK